MIIMNHLHLLSFNWYGFLIGSAFLIAVGGGFFMLRYKRYHTDILFDLVLVCIPLAIIGLRVHFVLFDVLAGRNTLAWWFQNARIFGFERVGGNLEFQGLSGLAIYGGLIAGSLGAFLGKKLNNRKFPDKPHKQMSILQIYDVFFILIILGQVIGRWGNFANVELYGRVVTNPSLHRLPFAVQGRSGNFYQALFFYESFFNLIGFGIMAWMFFGKMRSFDGAIFAFYCIWYGLLRTILEPMRRDGNIMRVWDGGPAVNLLISLAMMALGIVIVVLHIYRAKKAGKKPFLFVNKDALNDEYYGYDKTIEYLLKNVKTEESEQGEENTGSGFSFSEEKHGKTLDDPEFIEEENQDNKTSTEQDEFID